MKTINYKISIVLVIVLFACNNNETEDLENISTHKTITKLEVSYNLLDITPNVYHDYFKRTDYSAGISSLKSSSLSEHSIVKRINIKDQNKRQSLLINNKTIDQISNSNKISRNEGQSIYGKTISFKINTGDLSRDENEIEMYVPDLVEITNPQVNNPDEQFPVCYSENFILKWNVDPNNKEGLVIVAEYFGDNAIPENDTNRHILNTDVIDLDDGHAVLNNDLFKDIPNLSIVHLILLRGNVTIEEIEGELYKFFAESHVRLPLILLKDLNTIAKE